MSKTEREQKTIESAIEKAGLKVTPYFKDLATEAIEKYDERMARETGDDQLLRRGAVIEEVATAVVKKAGLQNAIAIAFENYRVAAVRVDQDGTNLSVQDVAERNVRLCVKGVVNAYVARSLHGR